MMMENEKKKEKKNEALRFYIYINAFFRCLSSFSQLGMSSRPFFTQSFFSVCDASLY